MTADVEQDEERRSGSQIVEYLQAPRKKRKNYVLFALSKQFDADLSSTLQVYLRQTFNSLALAHPKSPQELSRLLTRQIVLVLVDDAFASLDEIMEMVKSLKIKKAGSPVPVIFLTENPRELIAAYHKNLLAYQETDNYIPYRAMPLPQICARLHGALNIGRARRSRRFDLEVPVKFFHLTKDAFFNGQLIELSMHGAILITHDEQIFRDNDQLRLHVPTQRFLGPEHGDFLRLSAKVRRVLMGGNKVGISWEHLSEEQAFTLMQYLTELINSHTIRKVNKSKIKSRSNAPT